MTLSRTGAVNTYENEGSPKTIESIALLEYGRFEDALFVTDPSGLIVSERVFHDPASLALLIP